MSKFSYGISASVIAGAILFSSCSANLGPETLPSTTPYTEPTVETEPEPELTEETLPPEATEPASSAVVTEKIVESNGRLAIDGTNIVNAEGEPVVLKGITSFGIQDCEDFFTHDTIKTLAEDWGCDVIRIAITGDENSEGYLKDPEKYFDMVCKICDMCSEQGVYVIVDWNVCYLEDYDENKDAAVDFFKRLSAIYTESPNIIYEVTNDPVLTEEIEEDTDEWEDIIKPFVTDVIEAVRENETENIIIVGTPERGLDVDIASDSALDYDNIAYACRFFTGSQGDALKEKIRTAIDNEVCVFVTEIGFCNDQLFGGVFRKASGPWLEFLGENKISWCNYAIGNDSSNSANALDFSDENYTDEQRSGHWPDGLISDSGAYARDEFLKVEETAETTETEEE